MSDQKRSLHEVLLLKLRMAMIGITRSRPGNPALIADLLDSLFLGKMKATDAHKVAEDLAYLPDRLKSVGLTQIAEFAEEVLSDLRGREEEEKTEEVVALHEQ